MEQVLERLITKMDATKPTLEAVIQNIQEKI
jgi:hypothetical protein